MGLLSGLKKLVGRDKDFTDQPVFSKDDIDKQIENKQKLSVMERILDRISGSKDRVIDAVYDSKDYVSERVSSMLNGMRSFFGRKAMSVLDNSNSKSLHDIARSISLNSSFNGPVVIDEKEGRVLATKEINAKDSLDRHLYKSKGTVKETYSVARRQPGVARVVKNSIWGDLEKRNLNRGPAPRMRRTGTDDMVASPSSDVGAQNSIYRNGVSGLYSMLAIRYGVNMNKLNEAYEYSSLDSKALLARVVARNYAVNKFELLRSFDECSKDLYEDGVLNVSVLEDFIKSSLKNGVSKEEIPKISKELGEYAGILNRENVESGDAEFVELDKADDDLEEVSVDEAEDSLEEVSVDEAEDSLEEVSVDKADESLDNIRVDEADDSLEEVSIDKADDSLEEVSIDKAEDSLEEVSVDEADDGLDEINVDESEDSLEEVSVDESDGSLEEVSVDEAEDSLEEVAADDAEKKNEQDVRFKRLEDELKREREARVLLEKKVAEQGEIIAEQGETIAVLKVDVRNAANTALALLARDFKNGLELEEVSDSREVKVGSVLTNLDNLDDEDAYMRPFNTSDEMEAVDRSEVPGLSEGTDVQWIADGASLLDGESEVDEVMGNWFNSFD